MNQRFVLQFDLEKIKAIDFGVGFQGQERKDFFNVPIDNSVYSALSEMVEATRNSIQDAIQDSDQELRRYDPSEKYSANEYLFLPIGDEMGQKLFDLHEAARLPNDNRALSQLSDIICYYARFTDNQGRRLTAIRKAQYFKGDLRKKLIAWNDDTLKLVESKLFRLDSDFDLIIDSEYLHIWRVGSFESLGDLKEVILNSVLNNVKCIRDKLPFIDFDSIHAYASKRLRAARYISSIKNQNLQNIKCDKIKMLCEKANIEVSLNDGKIKVDENKIMTFLKILDRRVYHDQLVDNGQEVFEATSRQKLARNQ